MTEIEVRSLLSDALEYASVPGFAGGDTQRAFLSGQDVRFSELDLDSLAAMELCIAIETNLDVTILPNDLPEMGSLNALVRRVHELRDA